MGKSSRYPCSDCACHYTATPVLIRSPLPGQGGIPGWSQTTERFATADDQAGHDRSLAGSDTKRGNAASIMTGRIGGQLDFNGIEASIPLEKQVNLGSIMRSPMVKLRGGVQARD